MSTEIDIAAIRSQARREMAAHILAVDEVLEGLRCPYCHGRYVRQEGILYQVCGEGHRFRRGHGMEGGILQALRRVAAHDELPLMPPKRPLDAEGVLRQAAETGEDG